MRRRLAPGIIIPVIIVGLVATFAIVGALATDEPVTDTPDAREQSGASVASNGDSAGLAVGSAVAGKSTESATGGDDAGTSASSEPARTALPAGQKLIRTGQLSLTIAEGKLLAIVDRIGVMTSAIGGYVMSSSVGTVTVDSVRVYSNPGEGDALPVETNDSPSTASSSSVAPNQAWMTVRVPQRSFDAAVERFSELGKVTAISTSSDDVTAQFVDLRAQLRHYRAVERRLLRFLAETKTIREMLTIQDRIDAVQLTIEQLDAQLKSLDETTTFATLTISLEERGAPQPGQIDDSDTFSGVFWNSLTLLGRGARLTGLALTAGLPFLVVFAALGLATWFAVRKIRGRRQSQQQPSLPV